MIKGIVFDLDGVYFVNGKEAFIKKLTTLGVEEEEAKRVFLKSEEMNKLYKTGEWSDGDFWRWALDQWKLDKNLDIVSMLIEGYEVNKQVVEVVRKLRKNGYKLLICTNNFPARIQGLQNKFHFLDDFDAAAISYHIGVTKPDRKIFEALVEEAELQAEEIAFADDSAENIAGAKAMGISAFTYEGFDKFINKLKSMGVRLG